MESQNKTNPLNILLTGGTGFLGRNLINGLKYHKFINLGRNKNQNCDNIYWNLIDDININELPGKIDVVVHSASIIGNNDSYSKKEYFDVNVRSTIHLLELCATKKIDHFIYISSGAVYGEGENLWNETDNCNPKNMYGLSKYFSELLCKQYEDSFPITTLRLFFPYGNGQKGRFMDGLICKIRNNESIEINDLLSPLVNPVHISDLISIIELIINKKLSGTFNVAGNEKISIKEIGEIIAQQLNKSLQLNFNYNKKEKCNFLGSNVKLFRSLNYYPKTNLIKGIQEMCKWKIEFPHSDK